MKKHGKLIVKNFGPIKYAEIDLKQVMILIGPQGAGKSTLLKVIAAIQRYLRDADKLDFLGFETLCTQYYEVPRFSLVGAEIVYSNYGCHFEWKDGKVTSLKREIIKANLPNDVFIPAERNFFSIVDRRIFEITHYKVRLPNLLEVFGIWWRNAKEKVYSLEIEFFDSIKYSGVSGDFILYGPKDHSVLLQESASGFQSAIPMAIVIEFIATYPASLFEQFDATGGEGETALSDITAYSVFIEEPELNIFPTAQKRLVEFLARKLIQNHEKNNSLFISTHSPYILTAIDNLLQASNASKTHPEAEGQIEKVIARECWIDFDEVTAYYVEAGKTVPILDKKNRSIAANKIDKVSEEISIEFDKLLDLTYQKA
ncbi:MAG TPA: AAA family ATPase [Chitinophagales bacterium]|nr:AAA family ATPase [Chitinophagales bacterium]